MALTWGGGGDGSAGDGDDDIDPPKAVHSGRLSSKMADSASAGLGGSSHHYVRVEPWGRAQFW